MNPFIDDFFKQTGKEVIIDTNVLILYLVGSTNQEYIKKVKATKNIFNKNDYETIKNIILYYDKVITTPNILTELSLFAGQKKHLKKELFNQFNVMVCSSNFEEKFVKSPEISNDSSFNRLGLTDIAIAKLSEEKVGVITKDLDLCLELQSRGLQVLNFNYIMDYENK